MILFRIIRLSGNPPLKIIFKNNPTLLEKWKEPLEISILQIKQTTSIIILQPNLKSIVSAESWEDFLLMGTEVHNSCQRIDGDPKLIKCLLAYILDGKNKVILVKDTLGKIVARTVLRIMWDKAQKCPVLFMERLYTKGINKEFSILIRKGCETLAKKMKLTLVANKNDFPSGLPYNGELFALGGPCPFEYVDDLQEILSEGKFTIQNCNIICDFKAL